MATSFSLEGFDEVGRQAAALGKAAKGAVSSALLKGAKVIAPEVKARAPRAAVHRTGKGRSGKHMGDAAIAAKGNERTAGVTFEGGANGGSFYWKFLEHGTGKMHSRPFMAPAAEAKETEAYSAIADELKSKLGL